MLVLFFPPFRKRQRRGRQIINLSVPSRSLRRGTEVVEACIAHSNRFEEAQVSKGSGVLGALPAEDQTTSAAMMATLSEGELGVARGPRAVRGLLVVQPVL